MRRAALVAVGLLGVSATPAAAFPVVSGELDHAWANVYETGAPEKTNRTWLGYSTFVALANGTVSPVLPGTGPTVNALSPRGATAISVWKHPAALAGGSYDPATRTGTIEYTGGIRFQSIPHGFDITFQNPRIVLDGASGQLFATGTDQAGAAYDKSKPVYDLDLSKATVTDGGGSVTITGIVPRIATEGYVYPGASYPKGAGPDRTPNTFGSFALTAAATPGFGGPGTAQPEPTATPTPAATATATPTVTATATPRPTPAVPARVFGVHLSKRRLVFRLTRAVPTRVVVERRRGGRFRVQRRLRVNARRVSIKLRLRPGRHRVTITPRGGDSRSIARRF